MKGFTLSELLVVCAFIGIATALGIAAYSSYNSTRLVQSSAQDVAALLNTAKERSLSQVIPASCGSNQITGYQVAIAVNAQQYKLSAHCGSMQVLWTNNLPPQVTFTNGSTSTVFFPMATGAPTSPATISINGFGKTKTITISQTGNIILN